MLRDEYVIVKPDTFFIKSSIASSNFCEQKYSKRTRGRIVLKKT